MAKSNIAIINSSFGALEKAVQNRYVRSAINSALNPILKEARAAAPRGNAPHRTYKGRVVAPGFLSRSIVKSTGISRDKTFVFGTVRLKPEAWYGSLLEHGWRPGSRSASVKKASRKGSLSDSQLKGLGDSRARKPGLKWWSNAIKRAEAKVDAEFNKKLANRIMSQWRAAA